MKRKSENLGKAISIAVIASMLVAPVNVVFAASTDIHGHWAEKTIAQWQDKGLISGYQDGTFKPNSPSTRAEFTRIMNQALGLSSKGAVAFSDVSASDWFYNDVAIALGEAYTAGYPDGTFKPNETITRAQAAVFIANAIGASGGSVAAFTDSSAIPAWAKDSVGAIVEKGYMSGYPDGTFHPNAVLTRAEAVSTLNRIMEAATEETTVTEKDVVVDQDDTKLENQTIEGNLTISEKVGDGEVYLSNVEIKGDLIIQGGGDDSIYTENVVVEGKTLLDKKNVRLQVSGKTNLSKVEIKKACNLSASNFSGEVGTITITGAISDQTTIGVPADKLYVDGKANLLLKKAIGNVVVDKDAAGTKLELDKAAKVSTLTVGGKVALSGSGTISTLEANAGDITYTSGLTISKTVTASGVKAPLIAITSGGSSSGSSSASSIASVSTADEFETAIADNNFSTINVTADIADEVDATRTGSRSLTINFGTYTMGDVSITASAVAAITLNDSGVGAAGASIANLDIDAANAHVINNVQVIGTITILAVSHSTFVQQDTASVVDMRGQGALEFPAAVFGAGPLAPPPPPVFIHTPLPVGLSGIFGSIDVQQPSARLDFAGGAQVGQLSVGAGAPGGIFTTGVGVGIDQILASAGFSVGGTGTITAVDTMANGVAVGVTGAANVQGIYAVGGVTPPLITNTSIGIVASGVLQKAAAPTGLVPVTADAPNANGLISGTTSEMEYKIASAGDGDYFTCAEPFTPLLAGTYLVRIKGHGALLASNPVQVVIDAHLAPVTNIHYAVVGNSVRLLFDEPAVTTGIAAYNIEFSKDAGTTWGNLYEIPINSGFLCIMEDIARGLTESTTYNRVRVTSVAEEDSRYIDTVVTDTDIYAFTVTTEEAPAFTITRTASGIYTLTITDAIAGGAIYVLDVTKDGSTPDGYPLGYAIPYNSFDGNNKFIIDSSVDAEHPIVDGSAFVLKMIRPYTTTDMMVTKPSAKVYATAAATVNVTSATITGIAQVGETLTAAANADATNATYQWQANTGANGVYENIANAAAATFVVPASLVGKTIKVVINGDNSSSATSDATGAVAAAVASLAATPISYEAPSGMLGVSNTVALFGTTFADAAAVETLANWDIDTGTTNLQVASITRTGDNGVTIDYTLINAGQGTGTGTIAIKAKAAAVAAGIDTDSTDVVITLTPVAP